MPSDLIQLELADLAFNLACMQEGYLDDPRLAANGKDMTTLRDQVNAWRQIRSPRFKAAIATARPTFGKEAP